MLSKFSRMLLPVLAGLLLGSVPARAADYPSQPIRWIVPYGTGGAFDRIARGMAPLLQAKLGVPVVVENLAGPDGYNRVLKAKPDGYTIAIADPVGESAVSLIAKLPYDLKDATWLGRFNSAANLLVASSKSGIKSFAELKNRKETVRVATFGMTAPLVQAGILMDRAQVPITTVSFKTVGDYVFGVVRGDADVAVLGVQPLLKHIEAGSVVPLMIWDKERDPRVPDAPSLTEIGFAELEILTNHRSVIGPPGLPQNVKDTLVAAIRAVSEQGEGLEWLKAQKFETNPMWGPQFETTIAGVRQSIEQYRDLLIRIATQ